MDRLNPESQLLQRWEYVNTLVPLLVFVGAALFCIHEGHGGFAIVFTVFSALSVPKISVG